LRNLIIKTFKDLSESSLIEIKNDKKVLIFEIKLYICIAQQGSENGGGVRLTAC